MPNTITVCISASDQGPVLLSHFEVVENMEKYRLERLDQRGQSLWHVTRLRHSSDSTFRVRSISIVCTVMRCTRSLTPQHRARISVQLTTKLPPTRRRRRLLVGVGEILPARCKCKIAGANCSSLGASCARDLGLTPAHAGVFSENSDIRTIFRTHGAFLP